MLNIFSCACAHNLLSSLSTYEAIPLLWLLLPQGNKNSNSHTPGMCPRLSQSNVCIDCLAIEWQKERGPISIFTGADGDRWILLWEIGIAAVSQWLQGQILAIKWHQSVNCRISPRIHWSNGSSESFFITTVGNIVEAKPHQPTSNSVSYSISIW